ncbi:C4-dicarboxylate ABC transporter permease [Sulfitobacter sp. SK012]|uniref:TRAP transporter small permease n=1 Tax=Sulfitobacter sp. SK012 TaxID=1389005 RepID=UPI000E0C3A45|nr:TRAP transporter small permease [Sulfitobacter sp. SK012]AXI45003.1 C4-dicarboxylate ABC transporter permease [Sulfitobacter sp. SK012]
MHRAIQTLARVTALLGGGVLIILIVMTTLSISGRAINKLMHQTFFQEQMAGFSNFVLNLGVSEIRGNYELLEAGVAFSIFSFLPLCQLLGAHANVDVFTSFLPARANRWIAAFWEVVLAAVIVLIIVQLFSGMERYIRNGQTTFFLQFPVWWAYALSFAAGVVAVIVSIYCAIMRFAEAVQNRNLLPSETGGH